MEPQPDNSANMMNITDETSGDGLTQDSEVPLFVIEILVVVTALAIGFALVYWAVRRTRRSIHIDKEELPSGVTEFKIEHGLQIEKWGGEQGDEATRCALCSKPLEIGEVICKSYNPACLHVHHRVCITKWLHLQNTCPACNNTYVIEQV